MDRKLPDGTPVNKDPTKIRRFKFTPEDDAKLEGIVRSMQAPIDWKKVSVLMKTRSPRQCRERYNSHISYTICDSSWTNEEIEVLQKQVSIFGRRWDILAGFLPSHTPICIKDMWRQTNSTKTKNILPKKVSTSPLSAEVENVSVNEKDSVSIHQIFDTVMDDFNDFYFL